MDLKKDQESKEKLAQIRQLLDGVSRSLKSARYLLKELTGEETEPVFYEKTKKLTKGEKGEFVEGIFDGENMIGPDKKEYPVPPNYASKSKLIPGDTLKLTIASDGSFIYKQIKPIDRKQVVGSLIEENGEYKALASGKTYDLLLASVTYFKVSPGDQLTLIVPKKGESKFAAIENKIVESDEVEDKNTKKSKKKTKK
jgi:hypothetical protein